jgi:hypothetical protein
MTLLIVAGVLAVAYLALLAFALSLAVAAARADEALERAYRAADKHAALDDMGDEVDALVLDFRPRHTVGGWRI